MQDLKFENAQVLYQEKFLAGFETEKTFDTFWRFFKKEENKIVLDNSGNKAYRLNRKTMVFIDPKTVDQSVIPKIWGDKVKILEFTPELLNIKERIEKLSNFKFNICLVNYYHTGKNTIGYHSDNEEKGSTSCIASISIGTPRTFAFRKKSDKSEYYKMKLNNGSLLIMGQGCQENYEHSILADEECKDSRINFTFRLFDSERYVKY